MRAVVRAYLPFLLLIIAVSIIYRYLPLEWFLITTGLLILIVIFGKESKREEAVPVAKMPQIDHFLEGAGHAAFLYDSNFRILAFNTLAEKLFGVARASILGRAITPKDAETPGAERLVQIIFPSLAPTILSRSKEGEFPQIIDISFASPELDLRTVTSKIYDDQQALIGFLKIVTDRTKEVAMLREKGEFVTVASHQLRTPVSTLIWTTESLLKDPALSPAVKELASGAYDAAKKLGNLVEDLLSISRIEEGRFGYNFAPLDLPAFIEQVLGAVVPQAKRLGISVFFDKPAETLPHVFADASKLGIAFGNLLDNAIRYNVKDGQVSVKVKQGTGPFLEVSVRDTGIGIPREEVGKLFVKFYRGSNALKFETQGSGLGLYIASNIIQAHGGKINVESEVDHGTVFTLSLPTEKSLIPPKEVPLQ